MSNAAAHADGERALAELGSRLAAVAEADLVRPGTDPQSAAVTALLVSDYLLQPECGPKLAGAGVTAEDAYELARLARAILVLADRLGGEYLPDAKGIPGDLVQRATTVRASITNALETALGHDPTVRTWLEAIRLGTGVVDLVYDLRTLAEFCASPSAKSASAALELVASARAAGDALEFALRTGETAEHAKTRTALVRLWTMFVPAYEKARAAGHALATVEGRGREHDFPSLAIIASHRRARRRPLSLVPVAATPEKAAAPHAAPPKPKPPKPPPPPSIRMGTPEVHLDEVEIVDAADAAPAAPPTSSAWSEHRKESRQTVEIEVGIASQSNFYLGFTENLSSGGVFVATYARKPIGSRLEVALTFPNGDELRVPGTVRWLREASADGWPGLGVQFDALSEDDEKKIRKFLSMRDPLFYDD